MPLADRVLAWLIQLETRTADRALGAALDHAESPYREKLTQALLTRRRSGAWCTLFQRWDRLGEEARATLFQHPPLALDGLGLAIRDGPLHGRLNALTAFEQHPFPSLAHLLVNALLDPGSAQLRERAAGALRTAALAALESSEGTPDRVESDRRKIVDALREALRAVDTHLRVEVVEPCLWYAAALGPVLWSAIQRPRSRVAHVINECLGRWDHPRLAAFLLSALETPELRRRARGLLTEWRGPAQRAALLSQTGQLERDEVRRGVAGIKSPLWFEEGDARLGDVPSDLRRHAPRWVMAAGFTVPQRLRLFENWLRSDDLALQVAVVEALTQTGGAEARALLQSVVDGGGRAASRARECLGGAVAAEAPAPRSGDPSDAKPESDFALFWQWCRRTPVDQLVQGVAVLKRRIDGWADLLPAIGRSPDPYDRLLALYLLCEAGLTARFRGPLRALLRDDHIEVRHAAETLLDEHPGATPGTGHDPGVDRAGHRRIRHALEELRVELEKATGEYSAMVSQVRHLLRETETGVRFDEPSSPAETNRDAG